MKRTVLFRRSRRSLILISHNVRRVSSGSKWMRQASRPSIGLISCLLLTNCCISPTCHKDYLFRTNWEGRHAAFVEDLNAAVGKKFNDICLREHACPPTTLESGLVRYTAADFRPWLKGCTFWFDVNPVTNIVAAVGHTGTERQCTYMW